jgi:uncharacterized protein
MKGEDKMSEKKKVPIQEGLFTMPLSSNEEPHLLGAKCMNCGEKFFPSQERCPKCCYEQTEAFKLSSEGEVYSSTVVQIGSAPYSGPVPYCMGQIKLRDGVVVPAILVWKSEVPPSIGTPVKMILEKFKDNEAGDEVMQYKFKPVESEVSK